eukprot:gene25072-biopygen20945
MVAGAKPRTKVRHGWPAGPTRNRGGRTSNKGHRDGWEKWRSGTRPGRFFNSSHLMWDATTVASLRAGAPVSPAGASGAAARLGRRAGQRPATQRREQVRFTGGGVQVATREGEPGARRPRVPQEKRTKVVAISGPPTTDRQVPQRLRNPDSGGSGERQRGIW